MWKKLVGIVMLVGIVSGCGSNQLNDDALTNDNHDNGFRKVTSSRTNENSNTIDLAKDNPEPNIGSDVDKAKYVVNNLAHYEGASVSINGNNMWVTAQTKEDLTHRERMKKEAKLHKQLLQALPRYDINVKIEEK